LRSLSLLCLFLSLSANQCTVSRRDSPHEESWTPSPSTHHPRPVTSFVIYFNWSFIYIYLFFIFFTTLSQPCPTDRERGFAVRKLKTLPPLCWHLRKLFSSRFTFYRVWFMSCFPTFRSLTSPDSLGNSLWLCKSRMHKVKCEPYWGGI
jgi:hypothetical protein